MPNLLDAAAEAVFSVSDLNTHIKHVLGTDPILSDVAVAGEISNFKQHSSGHCYFSLKDDTAQIRCCLWRTAAGRLNFRPADGDKVVAVGQVELYVARGEVSFIVRQLNFAGQGALFEAFERLKAELAAEGLFDGARKKPLPAFPRRIGVITSPTGAVIRDIVNVLSRRYPLARVMLIPSKVQGFDAALDLMQALEFAEAWGELDVVIMARGGGSAEDLWCFNDEGLIRTAARFPIPLISAVGHETDFTLLDFVADMRAPTPSAAAELATPDAAELLAGIAHLKRRAARLAQGEIHGARQKLNYLRSRPSLKSPGEKLDQLQARVAELRIRAGDAAKRRVKIERQSLKAARAQLHALDPKRVLERGYVIVSDASNGQLFEGKENVQSGQKLNLAFHDGTIPATAD